MHGACVTTSTHKLSDFNTFKQESICKNTEAVFSTISLKKKAGLWHNQAVSLSPTLSNSSKLTNPTANSTGYQTSNWM
jgi:hypothetical protein